MARIGLYFGSFNPIHIGHIQVAILIWKKANFDEIWFVPSPLNPHKSEETLIPADIRLKWVQLALQHQDHMKCCDIEFTLPKPSYTHKTVANIYQQFPDHQFELIMGADNLHSFHSWQHAEELAKMCPLNVYPRPGYPKPQEPIPFNAKWFDAPLLDISATQIRDLLWNVDLTNHNTEELLQTLVPQEIIEDLTAFFQTIKP